MTTISIYKLTAQLLGKLTRIEDSANLTRIEEGYTDSDYAKSIDSIQSVLEEAEEAYGKNRNLEIYLIRDRAKSLRRKLLNFI